MCDLYIYSLRSFQMMIPQSPFLICPSHSHPFVQEFATFLLKTPLQQYGPVIPYCSLLELAELLGETGSEYIIYMRLECSPLLRLLSLFKIVILSSQKLFPKCLITLLCGKRLPK